MDPFISVIIPNYNHSDFLKERIESVLKQTFKNYEIIILDDCSTDNSREIIELYRNNPKVSAVIYNELNRGSTFKQWFKGIENAKGEYIWIAESDDYCDSNFLEVTSLLLDNNKNASLVYCSSLCHNTNSNSIYDLMFWYNDLAKGRWQNEFHNNGIKEIKKYLSRKNTIPNASAVLFRKDKTTDIGTEFFNYKLSGDWLFWIKLLQLGEVIYTTKTINYFRLHNKSVRHSESRNETSQIEQQKVIDYLLLEGIINKKRHFKLSKQNKPYKVLNIFDIFSNPLRSSFKFFIRLKESDIFRNK